MSTTPSQKEQQLVSIVTCTYKRQHFFENLKNMVIAQDYPHDKLEWIIIDDTPGVDSSAQFPAKLDGISVKYYYLKKKVSLARKRTLINHKAQGVYIVNMDDDDYYPPCRVSHAVSALETSGKPLAGSSIMYMYFTMDGSIYQLGPYRDNHGTAATLAYTKAYTLTHDFGDGHYAEEGVFTEEWKNPMEKLDPMKTVLAMSHSDNTIEKTMFLKERYGHLGRTVHHTEKKLEEFIKEQQVHDFYSGLKYEYKANEYTQEVINKMETNAHQAESQQQQLLAQRIIEELIQAHEIFYKQEIFLRGVQPVPLPPIAQQFLRAKSQQMQQIQQIQMQQAHAQAQAQQHAGPGAARPSA